MTGDKIDCIMNAVRKYGSALTNSEILNLISRIKFEEWYAINAFNYAENPIGSCECELQWAAWKAAQTMGVK